MNSLNITPDTKVLIALTRTTMQPIDALCELIDNAIDSFKHATEKGIVIDNPMVTVEIASKKDIKNGGGRICVADNGPGMTVEELEKSIRAGYSGNNAYDNLGLFGMGFNISTGKLGVRTRVATARPGAKDYILVDLDLNEINRSKSFQVPYEVKDRALYDPFFPTPERSGTVIEVTRWWPKGNANEDFAYKLAAIPAPTLRATIGRRYSTILREKKIRIVINNNDCHPYEPCVWSPSRFVVKQGVSVPACMNIDEIVGTVRKCEKCGTEIPLEGNECPECHCHEIRTVTQRIWGWVGIQRYDDPNDYGIDLIRNGRCICVAEKDAFFYYRDESQRLIKDYPIDNGGTNGRIIGEIHMDFVPVGFTKEDFERASVEWQRAIRCLRGETSLQPTKVPEGAQNTSYVYRLYQAYRKVEPGPKGLYMGEWDTVKDGPVRISRDKENELKQRFLKHEPGYFDDEEWYKLVEGAIVRPPTPEADGSKISKCPGCGAELPPDTETCPFCAEVVIGKKCQNPTCGKRIPLTAVTCPHCGSEQTGGSGSSSSGGGGLAVTVDAVWYCDVCKAKNSVADAVCVSCHAPKGAKNPVSEEFLSANSSKKDELSADGYELHLPNVDKLDKITFETFFTNGKIQRFGSAEALPFVEFRKVKKVRVFIDPTHPQFARGRLAIEETVAQEVAHYVMEYGLSESQRSELTCRLSIIADAIKRECWPDDFLPDRRRVAERVSDIMKAIKGQLADEYDPEDGYFDDLDDQGKKETLQAFVSNGIPQGQYSDMCAGGEFLRYVPDEFVYELFCLHPEDFFTKHVFRRSVSEESAKVFGADAVKELSRQSELQIRSSLQTLQAFSRMKNAASQDCDYLELVRLSANALVRKLAIDV